MKKIIRWLANRYGVTGEIKFHDRLLLINDLKAAAALCGDRRVSAKDLLSHVAATLDTTGWVMGVRVVKFIDHNKDRIIDERNTPNVVPYHLAKQPLTPDECFPCDIGLINPKNDHV